MVAFDQKPVARAEMLIRRPIGEVFEAFVDPNITSKFWFTKGSGRLEAGKRVEWAWEMYGVSSQADVKVIETNRRILVEWSGYDVTTTVEWIFTPRGDDQTFVSITHSGFVGDADKVLKQVVESTEGFTIALAGLKALYEHGVRLGLVADRFPDAVVTR